VSRGSIPDRPAALTRAADRIIAAQCISEIGTILARTVVLLTVVRLNGVTGVVAVMIAEAVPRLLIAFAPNAMITLLTGSGGGKAALVLQGILAVALGWVGPQLTLLCAIVAVKALMDGLWNLSVLRILKEAATGPEQVMQNNAKLTLYRSPLLTLGIVFGGALTDVFGFRICMWIDAATFFGAAALLLTGQMVASGRTQTATEESRRGVPAAPLWGILAAGATYAVFAGAYNVSAPLLFVEEYRFDGLTFGMVAGAYGVGVAVTGWTLRRLASERAIPPSWLLMTSGVSALIGILLIGLGGGVATCAAGVLAVGVSSAAFSNGYRVLVQGLQSAGTERNAAAANGVPATVLVLSTGATAVAVAAGLGAYAAMLLVAVLCCIALVLLTVGSTPRREVVVGD
jgi:hypothetical protein